MACLWSSGQCKAWPYHERVDGGVLAGTKGSCTSVCLRTMAARTEMASGTIGRQQTLERGHVIDAE
jgi:hypothetical protein